MNAKILVVLLFNCLFLLRAGAESYIGEERWVEMLRFARSTALSRRDLELVPRALPRPVPVKAALPSAPLFTPELWGGLPELDARDKEALLKELPRLDTSQVRKMTREKMDEILKKAMARNMSGLDLFTDKGLEGPTNAARRASRFFYVSSDALKVMKGYEFHSLFLLNGTTVDKKDFELSWIFAGGGSIHLFYTPKSFTFKHPEFTQYGGRYTFKNPIVQVIEGPGVVKVKNVYGPRGTVVERFSKTAENRVKVEGSLVFFSVDGEAELKPISISPAPQK